jgi:hypothetical protein
MGTRLALLALLASVTLATGCVAPLGLGAGPVHVPVARRSKVVAGGSAGFGASSSREQFQADASARYQVRSWFSIEGGLAYTTLRDRDGNREVVLSSIMPFVRPSFYVRRVSFGVALSGLGFGGGGGGFAYGLIEPRVGYGGDNWSVHAAWLRLGSTAVAGSTIETSAKHLRVGADYFTNVGPMRLGLAFDLTRGDDRISYTPDEGSTDAGGEWNETYTMGSFKLSVLTHAL